MHVCLSIFAGLSSVPDVLYRATGTPATVLTVGIV